MSNSVAGLRGFMVGKRKLFSSLLILLLFELSTAVSIGSATPPSAPKNLRTVATPAPVEPWLKDSFEGTPPKGWNEVWREKTLESYESAATTDEGGTPPGGGRYAYCHYYEAAAERFLIRADHQSNRFTAVGHDYDLKTCLRFAVDSGASLPGNIVTNAYYYPTNIEGDSFQLTRMGNIVNITDDGTGLFYIYRHQGSGRLSTEFGAESQPIPGWIKEGDDISISYWLKYHPEFDHGTPTGSKHWFLQGTLNGGSNRMHHGISGANGRMRIGVQLVDFGGVSGGLTANVNGDNSNVTDQNYYMPTGEWVKFDWYIRVGQTRLSLSGSLTPNAANQQLPLVAGVDNSSGSVHPYWSWSSASQTWFLWYAGANTWKITKELGAEPDQVVWQKVGSHISPIGDYIPAGGGVSGLATVSSLGATGVLKGWVNGVLRWDYSDTATIAYGAYSYFQYYAQYASGPPRGENQYRYLDLFRIGPGALVLQEQEDHGGL